MNYRSIPLNLKLLTFFLFVFLLPLTGCQTSKLQKEMPKIEKGVLDLRHWDFAKDGVVNLSGEWEFYWQQFLFPADFSQNKNPYADGYLAIPGVWNDIKVNEKFLPGEGFSTLRLNVLIPNSGEPLAIRTALIQTAFTFYVNGKAIISNGQVGKTSETSIAENHPVVQSFYPDRNQLELVLQISNFNHHKGGPRSIIKIGLPEDLSLARERTLSIKLFLAGAFCIMGFYHLGLYILRRKNRSTLYLSILSLAFAFRCVFSPDNYLIIFLPDFSWEARLKSEYLSLIIVVTSMVLFIRSLLPRDFFKPAYYFTLAIGAAYSVLVILTPCLFYSKYIQYYQFFSIAIALCLVFVLIIAMFRKREGTIILLLAFITLLIWGVTESLYFNEKIHSLLLVYSLQFMFMFLQAFFLSFRFDKAFTAVEILKDELNEKSEALKENIAKLSELDSLKDEFLANTSHELRTPLAGIIGLSESLLTEPQEPPTPKQTQNLRMIVQSGKRLSSLINDILDFSSIRHGEIILNPQPLSLRTITDLVIDFCQPLLARKSFEIHNNISQDLPLALADENRLQQILFNLLGNAIKYTDAGRIELKAAETGSFIRIEIRDTGRGISEKQLTRIFNAFDRGGEDDPKLGGTGLGLALTKKLVELHEGEIWVESKPGKGSCFFFTLPISNTTQDVTIKPSPPLIFTTPYKNEPVLLTYKANASGQTTAHLLVVDDDPIILRTMAQYLAQSGYSVTTSIDGLEAMEILKTQQDIQLVLLDIMMPGMNGYEFCQTIRREMNTYELPIIMLTARAQPEDIAKGLQSGANDYLIKPILREELLARVHNHLEQKESVQRLKENTRLRREIENRKQVELRLAVSQRRLARILDLIQKSLLTLNENLEITYCNQQAERQIGLLAQELVGESIHLLFPGFPMEVLSKQLAELSPADALSVSLPLKPKDTEKYSVEVSFIPFASKGETGYLMNLDTQTDHPPSSFPDSTSSEKRLERLERLMCNVVESLSQENPNLMRQIHQLPPVLDQADCVKPEQTEAMETRKLMVEVMMQSLRYWTQTTQKTKFDLAEESGLWNAMPDKDGTMRSRTLDRYLKLNTLPKRPNWENILQTAYFVRQNTPDTAADLAANLDEKVTQLESVLCLKE
ncbi:response regulator [bacterium]|nr:response regulator [bacterium]